MEFIELELEFPDIHVYLIETPGVLTVDSMKEPRSTEKQKES